jgi:PPP family 3-phenylpropionic acid transporter
VIPFRDDARRRALWLARAYYFFYFAAVGAFNPYLNLYFDQVGLSGSAIGLLAAVSPLCLIVVSPAWGSLADRYRAHRVLLPLASFAPILPVLLLGGVSRFEWLAGLITVMALFSTAINPLIDSATLELVEGTTHSFGAIRIGGTFGFIAGSVTGGELVGRLGPEASFAAYGVCMAGAGLVALGLPARRATLRASFRAGLRDLLAQRAFALFLAGGLLIGAALYAAFSFYPLRLQQLGASTTLIGLASALAALSEIPMMIYSQTVLRRLGPWGTAALGACMYAARWALVGLAPTPILAILTQLLNGLSFGAFLIGGIAYVDAHTPPGLSATAQAVFTAATIGVGAALGVIGGGWLYEHLGAAGFFFAASAATAGGLLLLVAARRSQPAARPTTL